MVVPPDPGFIARDGAGYLAYTARMMTTTAWLRCVARSGRVFHSATTWPTASRQCPSRRRPGTSTCCSRWRNFLKIYREVNESAVARKPSHAARTRCGNIEAPKTIFPSRPKFVRRGASLASMLARIARATVRSVVGE